MTAELRRNLVLAFVGLAGGFGLIVALFGSAELLKRPFAPAGRESPPSASDNRPDGSTALPAISGEGGTVAAGTKADSAPAPGKPADAKPDTAKPDTAKPDAAKPDAAKADARTPSFDLVRVEPTGETVVAGRGLPNTVVEMLVNGRPVAKALSDPNGQFALVPPALAPGNSEIVLRLTDPQGRESRSPQSVAVVVSPDRKTRPLVALSSPDSPTVVLSQPEAVAAAVAPAEKGTEANPTPGSAGSPPKVANVSPPSDKPAKADAGKTVSGQAPPGKAPAGTADVASRKTAALKIVSVDAQEGGRLYVTGQAAPGATVRLYLNDTLVAPASVGPDGKVVFTIGKGVAAGDYRVRIDQVDSVTGAVRTRAEVPFAFPESAARVATREPAGEGGRAGTGNATAGKATTAVPPPGVKPELGSHAAGQPHREPGPVASARDAAAGGSGTLSPAPRAEGPAATANARRPNQPAVHTAEPAPRSPEPPAANLSAASPANALAAASTGAATPAAAAGSAFVAEIATARITRGDSLWQISRKAYGSGLRYTVIYDANQEQIRDPDKIFPGQIFVLPKDEKGGRG